MQNIFNKSLNKKNLPFILAVAILGSLNHFLYDWTGGSSFAALFCPINESPWEHLKLLFFPFLFVTLWTAALCRFRDRRFFTAVFSALSAVWPSLWLLSTPTPASGVPTF